MERLDFNYRRDLLLRVALGIPSRSLHALREQVDDLRLNVEADRFLLQEGICGVRIWRSEVVTDILLCDVMAEHVIVCRQKTGVLLFEGRERSEKRVITDAFVRFRAD